MGKLQVIKQDKYEIGDNVAIRILNSVSVMTIVDKINNTIDESDIYFFTNNKDIKRESRKIEEILGKVVFN